MAKRKQQPPDEGSPAWMSTFSDLMNLLLCFFILLFASSTMDEGKIQKIAASFDNLSFSVISEGSVSLLTGEMLSGGMTQLADTDSVLSEAGKNIDGNTGDKSSSASPTLHPNTQRDNTPTYLNVYPDLPAQPQTSHLYMPHRLSHPVLP